jgi:hypothetical protein
MNKNFYITIAILFIIVTAAIYFTANTTGMNFRLLISGNVFFLIITFLSYYILNKSAADDNPRKFVNKMMASTMLRFFSCMAGAFGVIMYYKTTLPHINIYLLMFLYMIYTIIESYFVMKLNRRKS